VVEAATALTLHLQARERRCAAEDPERAAKSMRAAGSRGGVEPCDVHQLGGRVAIRASSSQRYRPRRASGRIIGHHIGTLFRERRKRTAMSWNPLHSSSKIAFKSFGPVATVPTWKSGAPRALVRPRPHARSVWTALIEPLISAIARRHELPLEKIVRQAGELQSLLIAQRFRPIAAMLASVAELPIDQHLTAMRKLKPLLDETVDYHARMKGRVSPPGLIVNALVRLISARLDPAARTVCVRSGLALVAHLPQCHQADYLHIFQSVIGRLSLGDQLQSFRASLLVSMEIHSHRMSDPAAVHPLVASTGALSGLHERALGKAAIDLLRASTHIAAVDRQAVEKTVIAALRARSASIGVERHALLPAEDRFPLFEELLGHSSSEDMGAYMLLLDMLPRMPQRTLKSAQELLAGPRPALLQ